MGVKDNGKIGVTKSFYQEMFLTYHKPLCVFVMKMVSPEEAEDIVDNVFMAMWEKQLRFNDLNHLKAFLFRAVYNQAITLVNHKKYVNRTMREMPREEWDEDNYLRNRIETEVYMEVVQAVEQLPERCREVFKLSYVDGLKVSEVARKLSISEDTVKTQRLKARKQLQEILKDLYPLCWFLFMLGR